MEQIKKLLDSKQIRPTVQRMKILKCLSEKKGHLTVDTIYEIIRKEIPTMSKTTVYNTLSSMAEVGIVVPIVITGKEARYELNTVQHHHFFCERCAKVIDIEVQCDHFCKGEINGHKINELHGYFKGVCKNCLTPEKGRKL
ncbi:MAG: hypothetical protein A2252_09720 [Elusimicrobia bacterium RIFOXYA2_FULL_39_19]|nr:MAG: hypothetical protein A2252_09720 [Elusimicrobia bacterium RIFOXYA2_FULL_39_19]